MRCGRRAVALRGSHNWKFEGECRTAVKKLALLLTGDFRAVNRRVLTALGLDTETRRLQDNRIRPGKDKDTVTIHDVRVINRGLAMELLVATLLTCLDRPREVKSWCTVSATGYPNNCAPGPHPDIVATYADFRIVAEVSCKRDARNTVFFEQQLDGAIRHAIAEAMLPGAARVYALIITGCSVETNSGMNAEYHAAVRRVRKRLAEEAPQRRQEGQVAPDVRLVPVKSAIFGEVCEAIFGAAGGSGAGLEITSATLAKALDEVYEGLADFRELDRKHWLRSTLVQALRSPAEERLPIEL